MEQKGKAIEFSDSNKVIDSITHLYKLIQMNHTSGKKIDQFEFTSLTECNQIKILVVTGLSELTFS